MRVPHEASPFISGFPMDDFKPPLLGPVIGHTTDSSCRIWIRADTDQPNEETGLFVLRQISENEAPKVISAGRFPLLNQSPAGPGFAAVKLLDTIGLLDLDALEANTSYEVAMATGLKDDWSPSPHASDPRILFREPQIVLIDQAKTIGRFTTFADPHHAHHGRTLRFLFGSCHYPGHPFQKEKSVQAFQRVDEVIEQKKPHCMLMGGDQIYADAFGNAAYQIDNVERLRERYTESWSGVWKQRVMSRLPTYMILDDHEIEDNWDSRRLSLPGKADVFDAGIRAYLTYQWSHGPRNHPVQTRHLPTRYPSLDYEFDVNGFAFFVMDTRTERSSDFIDAGTDTLISDRQLQAFRQWLGRNAGPKPKFVVSSVVFAPNSNGNRLNEKDTDGWQAYPKSRGDILGAIMNDGNPIQNVIFLCGDAHCSSLARLVMTSPGKPNTYAYCVTSSAFFAPFTVARRCRSDYVEDSILEQDTFRWIDEHGHSHSMDYRLMDTVEADNFTELDVQWDPQNEQNEINVVRYVGETDIVSTAIVLVR